MNRTSSSKPRWKEILGAITLGASLFFAGGAGAQIYDDFNTNYGGSTLGSGNIGNFGGGYSGGFYGGSENYGTASTGVVRGSVESLDFNRGVLTMRTEGGLVRLNARPQDLSGLNPGDVAGITFLNYNGQLWLEPDSYVGGFGGGGYYGDLDSFALAGEITGTVQSVNRRTGRVQISGQTLRAHPEQLSGVYPGSFVSFTYAQIGNTRWVEDISGGGYYGGGGFIGGGGYGGGGYYGGGFGNAGIP